MSMQMLTILQIVYLAATYLFVMVVIPAAVFFPFFEKKPLAVRFLAYLTIGNFYVMNLVFLLQLLHISNRFTLLLGILVPACTAIGVLHWNSWTKNALTYVGETTYGVMVKTVGLRLILTKMFRSIFRIVWEKLKDLAKGIARHPIDTFGMILIIGMVFWQYGTNILTSFGYMASDTPVHNYWINSMCDNKIFVAGVYPFGMHNIVYFMHEMFGMEIYTLLRIFGLWQVLLLHVCLLLFLRIVCKSEAAAYGAVAVYLVVNLLNYSAAERLYRTLPQEYGMIFILPAIVFLFRFFETRREESGSRGWNQDSTKDLALFAMNFSMTLAVHFYDTMVAGLFCVAAAIGFIGYVFRKAFFWRILLFGILSIAAAVLPMFLAYATGTKLEGSLRWGMSVIKSSQTAPSSSTEQATPAPESQSSDNTAFGAQDQDTAQQSPSGQTVQGTGTNQGTGTDQTQQSQPAVQKKESTVKKLWEKVCHVIRVMSATIDLYVSSSLGELFPGIELIMLLALFLGGTVCIFLGEKQYGCTLISVSAGVFFLCCLMISKTLGIPSLMDQSRCCTYLAYSLFAAFGLFLDFLLYVFSGWMGNETVQKGFSLVCAAALVLWLLSLCGVREAYRGEALEKNGAIVCVTNILRDNAPKTFTIISANDELRMVERKGFFYEIIDLLRNCEGGNTEDYLVIPTPKVYVFVEKIPGEYTVTSEYSGQSVSRESAAKKLPTAGGLGSYSGTNRHIVMSKMYYWVQEMKKLYENEISVYYEDEEFVCYQIEQNVYRPFDLSIDYGYNYAGLTVSEQER